MRWQKILVTFGYSYVWLFHRAWGISFIYNKRKEGPNIDSWGVLAVHGFASEKKLSAEEKKPLCDKSETIFRMGGGGGGTPSISKWWKGLKIVHVTVLATGPTIVGSRSCKSLFKLGASRLSKNTLKLPYLLKESFTTRDVDDKFWVTDIFFFQRKYSD